MQLVHLICQVGWTFCIWKGPFNTLENNKCFNNCSEFKRIAKSNCKCNFEIIFRDLKKVDKMAVKNIHIIKTFTANPLTANPNLF